MASTTLSTQAIEAEVREFARKFPTPSVRQMVALCETGRIEWAQAYEIAKRALAAGMAS